MKHILFDRLGLWPCLRNEERVHGGRSECVCHFESVVFPVHPLLVEKQTHHSTARCPTVGQLWTVFRRAGVVPTEEDFEETISKLNGARKNAREPFVAYGVRLSPYVHRL
ncbi:hypothetical protein ZHAS_00021826 [Anopheles sinensis]|uniref:Uncharacterized protein n=1 Tax=Anopheles sinensis TaxID=74873 RepID=A0A084WTP6_ANOSI|nr:hypothetical protein ZHAS_00021826 [Anopheles sinensis]